jgi:hypothetical protein
MRSLITTLLLGSVLSLAFVFPAPAQADDYWDNHWSWYDNTYRPYYYRGNRANPGYYNNYYGPGYSYGPGYGYGGYGYGNYGYGTPYRNYYGTSGFGYGRTYGGGQAVNIGGLQFGWR